MSTLTRLYTHVGGEGFEAIYVDGDVEYQNHLGRVWPGEMMRILSENEIDNVQEEEVDFKRDEKDRLLVTRYPHELDEVYESDDYEVK